MLALLLGACTDTTPSGLDGGSVERDGGPPPADAFPPEVEFDDTIVIQGLTAPVEVHVDDSGFLHVSCEVDDDCFAAEGYFHAVSR